MPPTTCATRWTEEQALFCGDHVMGWSTSVVAPPDGDMAAYLDSLEKLIARGDRILYPTHGSPITQPQTYLRELLAHRRMRETQILDALDKRRRIDALVAQSLYPDIAARAARRRRRPRCRRIWITWRPKARSRPARAAVTPRLIVPELVRRTASARQC
jgi:glyoxylase-like metal-dependent hydrolase (beta-lactamase superfamily II)